MEYSASSELTTKQKHHTTQDRHYTTLFLGFNFIMAPSSSSILHRITSIERACAEAVDPQIIDRKVSNISRARNKQYDFCSGLKRDLVRTRTALRTICRRCSSCSSSSNNSNCNNHSSSSEKCYYYYYGCTFRQLFDYTQGEIANLNRILQNLKRAEEIDFVLSTRTRTRTTTECFFIGVNDSCIIQLLDKFWEDDSPDDYSINHENVFRSTHQQQETIINNNNNKNSQTILYIPRSERKGRSYTDENLITKDLHLCHVCGEEISDDKERISIRTNVYHLKCLSCVSCGSYPHQKISYMTFDGQICCRPSCLQAYDGAHIKQQRK